MGRMLAERFWEFWWMEILPSCENRRLLPAIDQPRQDFADPLAQNLNR
jgi:hypothetical protein